MERKRPTQLRSEKKEEGSKGDTEQQQAKKKEMLDMVRDMADKGGTRVQIEAALSKQTNDAKKKKARKPTRSRGLAR